MKTTAVPAVKKKTKAQQIKEHASIIYQGLLLPIQHRLTMDRTPLPVEQVRGLFHSASRAAIDAAEIFYTNWESVKGKYSEPEID
jgi:hypothetical protein